MPSPQRKRDDWRALCAHLYPDDGVDPRDEKRRHAANKPKTDRKTRQLCKQVQRTLQLALGALPPAESLIGVTVWNVTPAPNASRLHVVMAVPVPSRAAEVAAVVRHHAGRLRAEVAAAITRRRTPELTFEFTVEEHNHG
jgi:ribosome-binding factor A